MNNSQISRLKRRTVPGDETTSPVTRVGGRRYSLIERVENNGFDLTGRASTPIDRHLHYPISDLLRNKGACLLQHRSCKVGGPAKSTSIRRSKFSADSRLGWAMVTIFQGTPTTPTRLFAYLLRRRRLKVEFSCPHSAAFDKVPSMIHDKQRANLLHQQVELEERLIDVAQAYLEAREPV